MNTYIEEIRKTLRQIKKTQEEKIDRIEKSSNRCIAYFTESISLSSQQEEENMIIGHFHVMNIGYSIIHQPIILIKIKSDLDFKFSGKFAPAEGKATLSIFEWERIKGKGDPNKEYWLKPLKVNQISPGERLTFSDFQLKFPISDMSVLSVDGFLYYEENPEGVGALNSINITM